MSFTFDEIVAQMTMRREEDTEPIRRMQLVREKYNGDQAILLPDVTGEPAMVAPIAQIVTDSIDFLSNRASGPRPAIACPAMDLTKDTGPGSFDYARTRRRILYGTWHECSVAETQIRRAYRHYFGYGTFALVAMPDNDYGVRVEMRDPLATYPELRTAEDTRSPLNVGFVYGRTAGWVRTKYPETAPMLDKLGSDPGRIIDLVEWIDEDDIVIGTLGPRMRYANSDTPWQRMYSSGAMELRRWPNQAGMVPAAIPRRVTLDKMMGQAYAAVGQQAHLERMTALEMTAAEKYVFPDVVVTGRDGRTPMLVSGSWKDGRTGEANFIQDGEVRLLQAAPGSMTMPTLDRVERAARLSSGLIPQAGGETYGALRTGRAIDAIGGFSTDPRVQEAQEVTARALATLNEGILAIYKGYWPKRKFTKFSGWAGDAGLVEFTPAEHIETTFNTVTYAFPGTDVSETSVAVGQLVGLRLMSRDTARTKHPFIEDAEQERTRVITEQLEDAMLQNMLAQAQSGQMPSIDLARVYELVLGGQPLHEAITKADDEARQRQVAQAPPPGPGQVMAPSQAPGLAAPGQGAETLDQTNPTQGPPPQASMNAAQLFRALNAGTGRR